MKAAVFEGPFKFNIQELTDFELKANEILVKVKTVGVCGSDMHRFKGELDFPKGRIMGHEFSGEVVEVGENVEHFSVGDKVTPFPITTCKKCEMCLKGQRNLCNNAFFGDAAKAFSEYVKLNTEKEDIYKLPGNVSFEEGAFVEPLAVAINSVKKACPQIPQNVVVLGAGPIGILITAVLTTYPVNVVVTDISDKRLKAAKELGVFQTINAGEVDVKEELKNMFGCKQFGIYHKGPDTDVVYEAAGASNTISQALDIVKARGKVVIAAYANPPITLNPNIIPQKELQVFGSFCYTEEFQEAIDLIAAKEVDFKSLITHEYPLERIQEAFETQADVNKSIKVIVKPDM